MKPRPHKTKPVPKLLQWWWRVTCRADFLCDNCKYDHPSACHRPRRPNAVKCPDYTPRGK